MTPEYLAKFLDGHEIGNLIPAEADVMAARHQLVILSHHIDKDIPDMPLVNIHLSGSIRNFQFIDQNNKIIYLSRKGLVEMDECIGLIKNIPMALLKLTHTPNYAVTFDLIGKQFYPFDICKDEEPYSQGIVFNINQIY